MMNHLDKITFTFVGIFLICGSLRAQINPDTLTTEPTVRPDTVIAFRSEIISLSRYTGQSVILRWSPDRAGGWHVGNQIGYFIERTEIGADSIFNPKDFKKIVESPIKPWPLADWEKIAGEGKSKYAAIAAQSLYGEGYKAEGILDNADEFQNRYSFALLAADFSPETAEALGLRFEDKSVDKNKTYIYRIFLAKPYENYTLDTAYQVVHTTNIEELPKVTPFEVVENELQITFYWDRNLYEQYYSAYYIERSIDGEKYERLTNEPYINALSADIKSNKDLIIFTDSVAQNYKPYYYRFIGLSPFGEQSTTAKPIKAMGRDRTPPIPPTSVDATPLSTSSVQITWQKETVEKDMLGYIVSRSQDFNGTFTPLFTKPIKPKKMEFIDKSPVPDGSNYYMISALDTAGNISNSMISYAMMIDSIPPMRPTGLTGKVDSTGLVTLEWALGPEKNIKGYNVYFSNSKDHVFTTVNNHPLQDTIFYDTIQVKTLTEEIFYCINAVDVNFNRSEMSDTLMIKRPDLIAPTSIVFGDFFIDKEGINLSWVNSSSTDVIEYILYRAVEKGELLEIGRFPVADNVTSYKDINVESNRIYTYGIITVDDAGLRSKMSQPMTLKMLDKREKPVVSDLTVKRNTDNKTVTVSWDYSNADANKFIVYRAVDGRNFKTYKTFDADVKTFEDNFIKPESQYEYTIKVKFNDGRESDFGEIVALK